MQSTFSRAIPRVIHRRFRLCRLDNNSGEHDLFGKPLSCFLRLLKIPQQYPIVRRVDGNVPEHSVTEYWTCSDSNRFHVGRTLEKVIGFAVTHIVRRQQKYAANGFVQ